MSSVNHLRWTTKKLARLGLASSAWAIGKTRANTPRLHVLTYHRFGMATRDPFCVPRQTFTRQMRWLADQQLAISLADIESFLAGTSTVPDGAVLVTIDDACQSVFTEALPVLRDYAIPAVLYVPAGLVGTSSTNDFGERVLGWDELAALQEHGIVVGSHGFHHWSMGRLSPEEAQKEAYDSRNLLSARLGTPITTFAYPFGTRAHHNRVTRSILQQAGYRTAFTSHHGGIRPHIDPLALPRVKIESGEPDWMFSLSCNGAMNAWSVIDAVR